MNQLWWSRIRALIRLEIKKTFFARRGIWIYLVAFLPVLLFVAYGIAAKSQENRAASIARQGQKVLSSQDLLAIKPGMSKEQVIGSLGKAPVIITWESGPGAPVHREHYEYSDGEHRLFVEIVNGKVEGVRVNEHRCVVRNISERHKSSMGSSATRSIRSGSLHGMRPAVA